jgi:hypothetical protein
VLIPLFAFEQCPEAMRIDLAYCIGNVFIYADLGKVKYFVDIGFLGLLVKAMSFTACPELIKVAVTAVHKLLKKVKKQELDYEVIRNEFERLGGLDVLE